MNKESQTIRIPYQERDDDLEIRLHVVNNPTATAPYIVAEQDGMTTSAFAHVVESYLEQLAGSGKKIPKCLSYMLQQEAQVKAMFAEYGQKTQGIVEQIRAQTEGYDNPKPYDQTIVDIDVPVFVDESAFREQQTQPLKRVPTPPPPIPSDVLSRQDTTADITLKLRPAYRPA